MDLLIDTNVLVDVFLQRKPFEKHSKQVFELCMAHKHNGIIAAHSFTNMYYIMRKNFRQEDLRQLLLILLENFTVVSIDKQKIINGLNRFSFPDFEDCLQDECADEFRCDFIITRNTNDFSTSKVQAVSPEEFLKLKAV